MPLYESARWWPHNGKRHAVPRSLERGAAGSTLCEEPITLASDEWPEEGSYWPTCDACDAKFRELEGLPVWVPEQCNYKDRSTKSKVGAS